MWSKMTSVQPDQSDAENPEDPVKELIRLVVKTILREEGISSGCELGLGL